MQLSQFQKWLSSAEVDSLIAQYKKGESTIELAEQFGCHRSTVVSILKRHGITPDKSRVTRKLDTSEIIKLYTEMHTLKEIAKQFGVAQKTIAKCLRDHGVAIRGKGVRTRK